MDFAKLSEGFAVDDENRRKAQAWDRLSEDNLVKQMLEDHGYDLFVWLVLVKIVSDLYYSS